MTLSWGADVSHFDVTDWCSSTVPVLFYSYLCVKSQSVESFMEHTLIICCFVVIDNHVFHLTLCAAWSMPTVFTTWWCSNSNLQELWNSSVGHHWISEAVKLYELSVYNKRCKNKFCSWVKGLSFACTMPVSLWLHMRTIQLFAVTVDTHVLM